MSIHSRNKRRRAFYDDQPGLFDAFGPQDDAADDLPVLDPAVLERPERLRFMSFGSGSSGNCAYIGSESGGVLIDAGVDNNYVLEQLKANAIDIRKLAGIILTHDHGDHVRYAYALLRRNPHLRLMATPRTLEGILRRHNISRRIKDYHQPIFREFPFKAGPLTITAFETSHDGTDNSGFFIEGCGTTFAITTDTGIVTPRADYYMRLARHIVLESNYDAEMLRTGPYTLYLKHRIASERGHLDNADASRYLKESFRPELATVLLCHLSEENNTPEIALSSMRTALVAAGAHIVDATVAPDSRKGHTILAALPRREASLLFTLE